MSMAEKSGACNDIMDDDGSGNITPEMAEDIASIMEKKNVNIVVAGKTGVGKSTLIGSLLPDQLSKVDVKTGPASSDRFILEKYQGMIGDSVVSLYDTRGYCSATTSERDAKCLIEKLRQEFGPESEQNIDLFIFCHHMFERFDQASLTSLTLFGGIAKASGWELCVVALTKANLLPPTIEEAEDAAEKMISIQEEIRKEMQEHYFKPRDLLKQSQEIPFVPVGYKTAKTNKSKLPCSEDSIEHLAKECLLRCNPESSIVLASAFSKNRIGLAVGVVGTSLAAGGIGALIGGLLTVYAGGVGTIPGAAIGTAIGAFLGITGASAAIGTKEAVQAVTKRIVEYVRKKKNTVKKKSE